MRDIIDILKDNGIEVAEEAQPALRKSIAKHYKTVNEVDDTVNKLQSQLNTANDTITDLSTKLANVSNVDVKALQDRIKKFEDDEAARKVADDKAAALKALQDRFAPLKGEKEFLNEGTEQWMFSEFEKALSLDENKSKGDAEIYEAITKDKNIYKTPNQVFTSPPVGGSAVPKGSKAYLDKYYEGNPFYKK